MRLCRMKRFWRDWWWWQESEKVFDQWFWFKAQILAVTCNHFHRFHAWRHVGEVAQLNGFNMIRVNASGFAGYFNGKAARFAFSLQKEANFLCWICRM